MLEYGGGCPASLAASAIKKTQNLQPLKVWSLSGAMHSNVCQSFTYKQL